MHYLHELDFEAAETVSLLDAAAELKAARGHSEHRQRMAGKHVALYFEKPSVRTRTSFTVAARELGADIVELGSSNTKVGKGEHIEDFAKVVSRYAHMIVARVFSQGALEAMAQAATVPVINALSDDHHPCQALADFLTIRERLGSISDRKICFVGEGNNVAISLALMGASLGASVWVASPANYGLPPWVLSRAAGLSGEIHQVEDPDAAVESAEVVYTDTWISMGQEAEAEERRKIFDAYRVTDALLDRAASSVIALHCLPAVRDEEITKAVMYSGRSAIWDQAENRLHVQKALMDRLHDS